MSELQPSLASLTGASEEAIAIADDRGSITWRVLDDHSNRMARRLHDAGLADGDHVAVVMTNRLEYYVALIAAMRGGFVVSPVKSTWTTDEVGYLLADACSKAVVTDLDVGRQCGAGAGAVVVDVGDESAGTGYRSWLEGADPTPQPNDRAGYRLSYTSGTTGRPKAVRLASAGRAPFTTSFPASAGFASMLGMPLDGPHLNCSALYHGAPLAFSLAALAGGATVRIMDHFDAARVLEVARGEAVRSTCMVPTMFRKLLALDPDLLAPGDGEAPLPRLGALVHGGEPCPRPLKQKMIDIFGPCLVEYYGFTEGGFCVADSTEWLAKPGTVGRALMGLEILVVDEDGQNLEPGEIGTIYFRDPAGPRFEYRGEPEKTEAAYRPTDHAFTVGDIGWVDSDGALFLCGRTTDVIISAGVNVYPAQIEEVISATPGVIDCCVVGGPHAERGEVPVATLVVDPQRADSDAETESVVAEARSRCEQYLARYERPDTWIITEALPRDGTGKLLRRNVRDPLWDGQDTSFAN